uniref:hypothetical protein n=1 Tax=Vibrio harveyi TaxID=669 RepID=UPI0006837FAC|nr:hypothetical protein [Vibrio harveyi]
MDTRLNKEKTDNDLSWAQLHQFSDMLVLESPEEMINAGANLLTILQDYFLNVDMSSQKESIPTDEFLSCLQVAEGMVRMGNQIRQHYDKQ